MPSITSPNYLTDRGRSGRRGGGEPSRGASTTGNRASFDADSVTLPARMSRSSWLAGPSCSEVAMFFPLLRIHAEVHGRPQPRITPPPQETSSDAQRPRGREVSLRGRTQEILRSPRALTSAQRQQEENRPRRRRLEPSDPVRNDASGARVPLLRERE